MARQITGEAAEKMRAALAAEIERIDAANVNGWQGCARVRLDNGGAVYFTVTARNTAQRRMRSRSMGASSCIA